MSIDFDHRAAADLDQIEDDIAAVRQSSVAVFQIRHTSYAVYYQPTPNGRLVLRILHASRNIAAMFTPPDPPVIPGS